MTVNNPNQLPVCLGADPGKSGAIVAIDLKGEYVDQVSGKATPKDISDWVAAISPRTLMAILEKVHSMPRDSAKSAFTFGFSYATMWVLFLAHGIRFIHKTPQQWMKLMECMTGGDKNVSKARAQEHFPRVKVTLRNADALLMAELARRMAVKIALASDEELEEASRPRRVIHRPTAQPTPPRRPAWMSKA
jgi:predicted RNase H-like nuclease (RuvC/YqgF family)